MKKNEIIIGVIKDKLHECYLSYNAFVAKECTAKKKGNISEIQLYHDLALRQLCKKNVLLDLIDTLNNDYDFDIELL